jgi:hypothetical protein
MPKSVAYFVGVNDPLKCAFANFVFFSKISLQMKLDESASNGFSISAGSEQGDRISLLNNGPKCGPTYFCQN